MNFHDARGPNGLRLYAIGDVHGRLDLLEAMHAAIRGELERDRPPDWRIIHLGDYVDRGPDSSGVLDFMASAVADDPHMIALAGNHDLGMLDFLDRPDSGSLFVRFGGLQTSLSYGVELDPKDEGVLEAGHSTLCDAVPARHLAFLRGLALSAAFGDFFFCHAGIRPDVPLDSQSRDDLVWIRQPFLRHAGLHPKVVVHGHTISESPEILPNRVNLDTGAWHSGVLTALVVDGSQKRLIEARSDGAGQ